MAGGGPAAAGGGSGALGAREYLAHLRADLDLFLVCLDGDLSVPVPHCGAWTLHDLADHLGGGNLWSAAAITQRHGRYQAEPAPRDPAALRNWLRGANATLLAALDGDPDAEAWTFAPPRTVGFWQRRRSLETLVHRWDAQHALGRAGVLDPVLADDGVAEVFDTMAPRMIRRELAVAPPYAVRFTATDTGTAWVFGPGEPVAAARGTAANLLLMLWGRLEADDPAIDWDGDPSAARAVLAGPLTP